MKNKILSYVSLGSLIIGGGIGGYALVDIYITRSSLPAGVCPVTSNRPLIFLAIVFLIVSLIVSFFEKKRSL